MTVTKCGGEVCRVRPCICPRNTVGEAATWVYYDDPDPEPKPLADIEIDRDGHARALTWLGRDLLTRLGRT